MRRFYRFMRIYKYHVERKRNVSRKGEYAELIATRGKSFCRLLFCDEVGDVRDKRGKLRK